MTLDYETALTRIFADGRVPAGPLGGTVPASFALADNGTIVTVHDAGCHVTHGLPPATDEAEAIWLLRNHPSSRVTGV